MKVEILIFFYNYWYLFLGLVFGISIFFYYFDKKNKYDDIKKEKKYIDKSKNDFILSMDLIGLRVSTIVSIIIIMIFVIIYYFSTS